MSATADAAAEDNDDEEGGVSGATITCSSLTSAGGGGEYLITGRSDTALWAEHESRTKREKKIKQDRKKPNTTNSNQSHTEVQSHCRR